MHLTDTERALIDAATAGDDAEFDRLAAVLDAADAEREARLAAPGALVATALWYAQQGVPVFPCQPGGKAPATRHGFKDASTEPDRVRAWWAATPRANIGLATGHRFDVFDADGPAGILALGQYMDAGGFPPILGKALTPHGRHYYVPPAGMGNKAGVLPQVDYRGTGGYVVAPPSLTPDGRYRWVPDQPLNLHLDRRPVDTPGADPIELINRETGAAGA